MEDAVVAGDWPVSLEEAVEAGDGPVVAVFLDDAVEKGDAGVLVPCVAVSVRDVALPAPRLVASSSVSVCSSGSETEVLVMGPILSLPFLLVRFLSV